MASLKDLIDLLDGLFPNSILTTILLLLLINKRDGIFHLFLGLFLNNLQVNHILLLLQMICTGWRRWFKLVFLMLVLWPVSDQSGKQVPIRIHVVVRVDFIVRTLLILKDSLRLHKIVLITFIPVHGPQIQEILTVVPGARLPFSPHT